MKKFVFTTLMFFIMASKSFAADVFPADTIPNNVYCATLGGFEFNYSRVTSYIITEDGRFFFKMAIFTPSANKWNNVAGFYEILTPRSYSTDSSGILNGMYQSSVRSLLVNSYNAGTMLDLCLGVRNGTYQGKSMIVDSVKFARTEDAITVTVPPSAG